MAILEGNLWFEVKPWEFLNQRWTKPNKQQSAPGILAMIKHINKVQTFFISFKIMKIQFCCLNTKIKRSVLLLQISLWVSTEILKETELSERVKKINYFIEVASV
jgi:hypothetical protein